MPVGVALALIEAPTPSSLLGNKPLECKTGYPEKVPEIAVPVASVRYADYSANWISSGLPTTRELPVFALPPVSPRSAASRYRNRWKAPLAVELPERDANRCILVRGGKPVFVLLCDAEEMLHLLRSWRCGRTVRIEWLCELAEEAVEFLLGHGY
jgi:hypothetical protein